MLKVDQVGVVLRQGFWMKPKQILKNISFEIKEPGVYGILGPNGAGKTTLIQQLVGLFPPTTGSITLEGKNIQNLESRGSLGFLPERPYFYPHLTARQFLKLMGTLMHMDSERIKSRTREVLSRVGLTSAIDTELSRFSKGMLQRIGIAQCLLHDPNWIILDEPMSGLDPLGRRDVRQLIQELGEQGKTVIFSSHVLSDLESLAREIIILKNGELLAFKKTKELLVLEASSKIELLVESPDGDHATLVANDLEHAQAMIKQKLAEGFKLHRMSTQGSALEKWIQ